MALSENVQHDLLLVITSMLFILFVTGCAGPSEISEEPTIIPG
ncbi:hypothetical protein [Inediibacterium massiliense]|nr:hypothetical protein [Inediibacterium massiliense]